MTRFILIACLFMACNAPEPKDNTAAADSSGSQPVTATPLASGCYRWAVNKDTATMRLVVAGNNITGDLAYNWSEKDRNKGTLQGLVKDSLIVADYTFISEGMTSVRQVVFKIKGDSLAEGSGDIITNGDTVKFRNPEQLQYQQDRFFKKIPCK